jgi:fermentation-respiration switch protein FrsA (DUF1100 family)
MHARPSSPEASVERSSRRARTLVRRLALVCAALVCAWLAATGFVTWRLLARARPPYSEPLPASLQGRVESVRLATRDGEELGAWWSGDADRDLAALILHGNHGSRGEAAPLVTWLAERGIGALALTMRAHGDSSGDVNDAGWSAREDVLAGAAFLEQRAPRARIVIIGRSQGAAAAIFAAGELGARASAYVIEAPYRDLASAVRARLSRALPAPAACVAFAGMRVWALVLLTPAIDAVNPLDRIADVPAATPILFLTGVNDDRAPPSDVEAIAARARGPVEIVRFEGAEHVALHEHDRARYEAVLARFLDRLEHPLIGR